jgi:poly(3-hydroxybutyrate) depolymerase
MLLRILVLLWLASAMFAQDAGLALRTRVDYETQKATLPLSEEQRRSATELGARAQQHYGQGKFGDALRTFYQGLAVMRKVSWTPPVEFAWSLQGKLDHAVVEPGARVTIVLKPLYETAGAKTTAQLVLVPVTEGAAGTPLGEPLNIEGARFQTSVTLPETPGGYTLEVRLAGESDPANAPVRGVFVKRLPLTIDRLSADVQRLRARLAKAPRKDGIATAEYAMTLYERADSGDLNPTRVNFREEFARANTILDAIEAGKDPFAKHGDSHRAYRSEVDDSLQPYRLFIPSTYDGSKAAPLLIALHGMGGDENSLFDSYSNGALKREAERVGFIVACPKGRDPASMYRGDAERDVLDVLAEVRRTFRVDEKRIHLMGHSMGAYGTWSVAMNHPEIFAALGPISGGGSPAGIAKIKHIPQYVVHGDDDRTVAVTQSRAMVEAGKKAGAEIVYTEIPGGSHTNVAAPAFAPMLDFFAKHQKP